MELPESQPEDTPKTAEPKSTNKKTNDQELVTAPPAERPKPHRGLVLVLIGLAAVIGLGYLYGLPLFRHKTAAPVSTTTTKVAKPLTGDEAILQKFGHPTTGEVWLESPKKLTPQGFFSSSDSDMNTTYYQVGTRGTNTIIMTVTDMVGEVVQFFEKTSSGKVTVIRQPSATATYYAEDQKTVQAQYATKVALDTTTHYDSVSMPNSFKLNNGETLTQPKYFDLGNLVVDPKELSQNAPVDTVVTKYGGNSLVKSLVNYVDTGLSAISYDILTPFHTRIRLGYQPFPEDLKDYAWTHGTASVTDTMSAVTRGCGVTGGSVTRSNTVKDTDVQDVGKTPDGTVVYELKSTSHPLFTKAYKEFLESGDTSSPYANISRADFQKEHGLILIKDKSSQWLVYARDQLRLQGGCAKPVVYLYPRQTQAVSVRVGAQVGVSLPSYDPKTGWQVLAHPDGSLWVAGRSYGSLLWEGQGNGTYPGIEAGTVVAQAQLLPTIRKQLSEQGLNAQESADFLAYWSSRLPRDPYIRLTWFNTAQMNQLAPLNISPRPDTLIRIFLDASGLDKPMSLPPQRLTAIPRAGFTVVEWGGLAGFRLQ